MGENNSIEQDFVQLSKMAVNEQWEDARLFVARVLRRRRYESPGLTAELDSLLKSKSGRRNGVLRDQSRSFDATSRPTASTMVGSLVQRFDGDPEPPPILNPYTELLIEQLVQERRQASSLRKIGLAPSRSAIFEGPPGVGKTLAAKWIAERLGKPLFILDLASVMSSYLGQTGSNIRDALNYAKSEDCVLLLDEIDAIAKRRSDESDIGELKRLVTVFLQQIDNWPDTSLLLAATNHADVIDRALWRRFDTVIHFRLPDQEQLKDAVKRFFDRDVKAFSKWIDPIVLVSGNESFGAMEKTVYRFRRSYALKIGDPDELVTKYIAERARNLDSSERVRVAVSLFKLSKMSQHKVSELTGVARDTIRKYSKT